MKRIVMTVMVLGSLTWTLMGERLRPQFPKEFRSPKLQLLAVDFEIRNVNVPLKISCREPFLTVTFEVWNIGLKDYDPANGMAELYFDLHDADTNSPIRFIWFPMERVIKAGQYQRWKIPSSRRQIYPQAVPNFNAANFISCLLCADEQWVAGDSDWRNNIARTGRIDKKCTGKDLLQIGK